MQNKSDYTILNWDSELFGYKVALINSSFRDDLRNILADLKSKKVKVAYLLLSPQDIRLNNFAEKADGVLVDERITYEIDASKINASDHNKFITVYDKRHVSKELLKLTLQSGACSRFKRDLNFDNNEYEKLYTAWIRKTVNHELGYEILVYQNAKSSCMGFITLGKSKDTGKIDLLSVDEKYRRKSVGSMLIRDALYRLKSAKCNRVIVTTQKLNTAACSFYEKIGFTPYKHENIYHFWII